MTQPHSLIISDLHLAESHAETNALFFKFLTDKAAFAEKLYILGDFFEFWLGDDDNAPLNQQVIAALKKLHLSGTEIFIMHGNRDFLLGAQFFSASQSIFLKDPTVLELYGHKLLLLHGDSLCTDDLKYQRYRRVVNLWLVQKWFLSRSLKKRHAMAVKLRNSNPHKDKNYQPRNDISDVNANAVLKAFRKHKVKTMIHGHTHRLGIHYYDDGEKVRYVLGDWHQKGSYIEVSEEAIRLHEWP